MGEEIAISLPLDSDGFLRRKCPHCSGEFKWHHGDSDSDSVMEPDGYRCPYCDGRSTDEWLTVAQQAAVEDELTYFAERQIHDAFKGMEGQSSKFLKIEAGAPPTPRNRPPLTEPDDMRHVDFACHPAEPVKVVDTWTEPVYCLVCGQIAV